MTCFVIKTCCYILGVEQRVPDHFEAYLLSVQQLVKRTHVRTHQVSGGLHVGKRLPEAAEEEGAAHERV